MTINNHLHVDCHRTVTVIVTEETAWASGLLLDVTVVTLVTVVCGGLLKGNLDRPLFDTGFVG